MKRHYILKNKKRFYTLIITFTVMIMTTFFATAVYGSEGTKYNIVNVKRGDTLWTIAGDYCKNGDIRRNIYEIKKANSMTSSVIFEGDELKIPQ